MKSFKQFEHEGWERVANNYVSAWTSLTTQFIEPLLNATDVRAEMRALDVACGPGHLAAAATQRGAIAVGMDFSKNMVHVALQTYPDVEFIEGDAENLPFPPATFDRVLINFGVLHFARPERAFAEARRVMPRGGKIGFTVWAKSDMNAGARIINNAVEAHADLSVPLPEGPAYFQFSEPEACRKSLEAAGFSGDSMSFYTLAIFWRVPTVRFLFDAERSAGVRSGGLLALQSPERLEAIRAMVEKGVERYSTHSGYEIPMTAHIVTAEAE